MLTSVGQDPLAEETSQKVSVWKARARVMPTCPHAHMSGAVSVVVRMALVASAAAPTGTRPRGSSGRSLLKGKRAGFCRNEGGVRNFHLESGYFLSEVQPPPTNPGAFEGFPKNWGCKKPPPPSGGRNSPCETQELPLQRLNIHKQKNKTQTNTTQYNTNTNERSNERTNERRHKQTNKQTVKHCENSCGLMGGLIRNEKRTSDPPQRGPGRPHCWTRGCWKRGLAASSPSAGGTRW